MRLAWEDYNTALEELRDVRGEYERLLDDLPEDLQSSPLAEKLKDISYINLDREIQEPDFDTLESAAQECLNADLPLESNQQTRAPMVTRPRAGKPSGPVDSGVPKRKSKGPSIEQDRNAPKCA
jgi:hypothetical protein